MAPDLFDRGPPHTEGVTMKRCAMRVCAAVVGAFACFAASAPLHAQAPANPLPAGEGRDLLTSACTNCHGLQTITAMRDGQGGWKAQVYNMVLRGAPLNAAETDTLIAYLAANF